MAHLDGRRLNLRNSPMRDAFASLAGSLFLFFMCQFVVHASEGRCTAGLVLCGEPLGACLRG